MSELEKSLRSLMSRYLPWLTRNAYSQRLAPTYKPYKDLDIFLDLIPAAILCHCRNIRRLDRLNIGSRSGRGPDIQFIWKHLVDSSITFPNLESANLVTAYRLSQSEEVKMYELDQIPIVEAICFISRAPNLKHLSLTGFSSEDWAGMTLRAPLPPLQNLSSLELHYCAWLNEAHLHDIIDACPKLATFKFTSEASPTTGQPIPTSSGFNFVGPALVLNALRPRSKTFTAISIRYMPVLDLLFRTHSIMDTDKNLIRTLGHFPNLRVLQISHDALQWTDSDGPEGEQENSWLD